MKSFLKNFSLVLLFFIAIPSYAFARGEEELIVSILTILAVIAVVFLVLREVMCWYWKINEGLSLLKEIRNLLSKLSLDMDEFVGIEKKTDSDSEFENSELAEDGEEYVSEEEIMETLNEDENDEKEIADANAKKIEKNEKFSQVYDENKDSILRELKSTLRSKDELNIINGLSRLNYHDLIKMGQNLSDLTETGVKVYKLLTEKIESFCQNNQ